MLKPNAMAMASTTSELVWVGSLLTEIGISVTESQGHVL